MWFGWDPGGYANVSMSDYASMSGPPDYYNYFLLGGNQGSADLAMSGSSTLHTFDLVQFGGNGAATVTMGDFSQIYDINTLNLATGAVSGGSGASSVTMTMNGNSIVSVYGGANFAHDTGVVNLTMNNFSSMLWGAEARIGQTGGNAALTMTGNSSITATNVRYGCFNGTATLDMSGDAHVTNTGFFALGDSENWTGGSNGTINMSGNSRIDQAGEVFYLGLWSDSHGILNMTDTASFYMAGFDLRVGDNWFDNATASTKGEGDVTMSGSSYMSLSGTTLTIANLGNSRGAMTMTDNAVLDIDSRVSIGPGGGDGTLIVQGNASLNSLSDCVVGWDGGPGTLTVGGTATVDFSNITFGASGANSTINLDGGTLSVANLHSYNYPTSSILNLNGGVLKATADNTNFIDFETYGAPTTSLLNVMAGGANIDTNGFNVLIKQSFEDPGATGGTFTKLGSGVLTLTGASTYAGPTVVSAGTLAMKGGSLASMDITVATAAALNLTNGAGANLSAMPLNSFTLADNSSLGVYLQTPDVAANAISAAVITVPTTGGTAATLNISSLDPTMSGAYTVLQQTSGQINGGAPVLLNVTSNTRYTLSGALSGPGDAYTVTVTGGAPLALTWDGAASGNWMTKDAVNNDWNAGADTFYECDTVTFNDTATTTTVNLLGVLHPGSITVNTDAIYTFNGTGRIVGNGTTLSMTSASGSGVLVMNNSAADDNGFTGNVEINSGTIQIGPDSGPDPLGVGPGVINIQPASTLDLNGKALGAKMVNVLNPASTLTNTNTLAAGNMQNVTFTGDNGTPPLYTIASPGRLEVAGGSINGTGKYDILMTGLDFVLQNDTDDGNMRNIEIAAGNMEFVNTITLGDTAGTITVSGGQLTLWDTNDSATLVKANVIGNGGKLYSAYNNILNAPIQLNTTMEIGSDAGTLQLPDVISETVAGSGITKTGGGIVRLANVANTYSGPTVMQGGTLEVVKLDNGGAVSSIGMSGAASSNLSVQGTFHYIGTDPVVTNRGFQIVGDATMMLDGDVEFNGIVDGSFGAVSLQKLGPGTTLTLYDPTATPTSFGADSLVQEGTLELNGSTAYTQTGWWNLAAWNPTTAAR